MSQRLMRSGAAPMTGALKIVDGTVGSPSVQFANSPSTGFYKTADGIGVSISGTKVAELTSHGIVKSARFIGEIFDWTGTTAPPLCVLPYGQTLSRTDYADLWAFAQTEIAAGNTFYNNGNGSTTFGIGDCRGRVRASIDNMGGSAASRLTSVGLGVSGTVIGNAGASESYTLVTANLPPYTPAGTIAGTSFIGWSFDGYQPPGGGSRNGINNISSGVLTNSANLNLTGTFTGTPQGGTSTPFSRVQPTILMNCALFAGA